MIICMVESYQAARVLAKLRGGSEKCRKDTRSFKDNCATDDSSRSNRVNNGIDLSGSSVALTSHQDISNGEDKEEKLQKCNSLSVVNIPDAIFVHIELLVFSKIVLLSPSQRTFVNVLVCPFPKTLC